MPTKHSPRRSPRLDASGVPAAATTTAKTTRNLTSSADVAGDHDCASGGHNGKDRTITPSPIPLFPTTPCLRVPACSLTRTTSRPDRDKDVMGQGVSSSGEATLVLGPPDPFDTPDPSPHPYGR
ncbi:GD17689 [Drosophila simulans]|uniref:GD17689 n=1 Tax=Drosophila simulans TaxID=7240 RepID=B4NSR4_DROSI|nr:GD17689 [Drosophila simulans]